MTGHYCPVEGCEKSDDEWDDDRPPFTSEEGVRGHINAMSDDDHQRARDNGAWVEATEAGKGRDGEGNTTSDDQANDQPEGGDQGASSGGSPPSTSPSSNDEMTSTSDDQADDQQKPADITDPWDPNEQATDQQKGDEKAPSRGGSSPSTGPLSSGSGIPVAVFLIGAGVALAVLLILWRRRRNTIDVDSADPTPDEDESTTNSIDREAGGGLVD